MKEQIICEIVETAFKARFGNVKIIRSTYGPGFGHYDDPMVDVKVIYGGKAEQLDRAGIVDVRSEIISKVQADSAEGPGFPFVHSIAKSDIGRRDPADCLMQGEIKCL